MGLSFFAVEVAKAEMHAQEPSYTGYIKDVNADEMGHERVDREN